MGKRQNESFSIQDLMKEVLSENNLSNGILQIEIKEIWSKVMGSGVASYTHNVQLQKGVLLVSLTSSVLKEELSYGKDKIVAIMNEELQKKIIKSVRFL